MCKELDNIMTMEQLQIFIKNKPGYFTKKDLLFARERIFSQEITKVIETNNDILDNIFHITKNKMNTPFALD
jgi:hypothetical protein